MTPTTATDKGYAPGGPGGAKVNVYGLTLGYAYCMTSGEWKLTPVLKCDQWSVEYTYRILWVQGRACAVFSVHGQDHWAQPINGNVAPGVAKREKAAARAEKAAAPVVVEPRPPPAPEAPAAPAGPSKAAAKLAAMRARAAKKE